MQKTCDFGEFQGISDVIGETIFEIVSELIACYNSEESRLERGGEAGLNGGSEPHYFCPVYQSGRALYGLISNIERWSYRASCYMGSKP